MRVLFLVSDGNWSARARAFVLAARGLKARGHDVLLACDAEGPVQMRAAASDVPVLPLRADASVAGDAWQLRHALQDKKVDVVFVHTDEEHLVAGSALRLGRGAGAVIRRVPPFTLASRGSRVATRMATTALLFSTEADRQAAGDVGRHQLLAAIAPLSVDPAEHERAAPMTRESLGADADSLLIVCAHDGGHKRRVFAVLRTVALLAPRHPNLHVAVIGEARQDELRMHGAALGINAKVTYLGARQDELSIIRAADVGWIAAEGDAAAFAALDFMACRTAVLAERSPLTEHFVSDGVAGLLLAQTDATTVAAAVAAFLEQKERRVTMGNAGNARLLRDFGLDAMIDGFEQAMTAVGGRTAQTVP